MSDKEHLVSGINGSSRNYCSVENGGSNGDCVGTSADNIDLERIQSSLPLGYPQLAKHEILNSLRERSVSTANNTGNTVATKQLTNLPLAIAIIKETIPEDTRIFQTRKDWFVFLTLLYGNFCIAACVSLQAPFFPSEAEKKGASPSQYGFVFGIYELMILITAPMFGKMVNRYSAVTICKYGMVLCGISTMVFGLIDKLPSGWSFIYSSYLIRIVEGIAASAFLTASYTVMAAKFPTKVARIFAYLEAAFGVGMIIGPTVGGALFQLGGFIYPFVILGSFLVFGYFLLMFIKMPKTSLSSSSTRANSKNNMWRFINDRTVMFDVCGIITTLNFLGFNAATLEPHLRQFNLTPFQIGLVFVVNGAVYALSTPIWGKLVEKNVDPKVLIVFGSFLCSIGLLFLGPVSFISLEPSLPLIVMSLLLIGFGMSAKLVSSFMDAMNDSIKLRGFDDDVSTYGLVSAMFFTSCSIGAFIGPSAGGFLIEVLGYRPSTVIVFVIDVFMTIYGIFFTSCRKVKNVSNKTVCVIGA